MKEPYSQPDESEKLRDKIIGLGERSYRKSYYPELQQKLADLERFKTLLDQINDAIFLIEMPSRRITDVNNSASVQTGYTIDELCRMTLNDLIQGRKEELHKLFSDEIRSLIIETELVRKDHRNIVYEIGMRRVQFRNTPYIVAVARDITARKEAEKELLAANSQAELYLDLMGHDINNMNQAAMGFLELAIEKLHVTGPECRDGEALINQAIEDMQNSSMLIDNVRKLRKARSGAFKPREIDLTALLHDIKNKLVTAIDRKVTIKIESQTECKICASELIEDVFTHVINNAIKHSTGPLEIDIRLTKEQVNGTNYCQVSVEDNGPGIPETKKRGLFDIRQRGKARISGKGLGLYIVKTIVDDFQGQVWVENRVPGDYTKGSRFIILLPAVKE